MLRELAILTIAAEMDCPQEWTAHEAIREEALAIVRHRQHLSGLTEEEALVVRYGQELVRQHQVSADTFQAALQRFGAQGVTELTATVGYYAMIGLVRNALEV